MAGGVGFTWPSVPSVDAVLGEGRSLAKAALSSSVRLASASNATPSTLIVCALARALAMV